MSRKRKGDSGRGFRKEGGAERVGKGGTGFLLDGGSWRRDARRLRGFVFGGALAASLTSSLIHLLLSPSRSRYPRFSRCSFPSRLHASAPPLPPPSTTFSAAAKSTLFDETCIPPRLCSPHAEPWPSYVARSITPPKVSSSNEHSAPCCILELPVSPLLAGARERGTPCDG